MGQEDRTLKELQEKVKELEMVFQSSHEEIFVTDGEGTCIRVNPACERHYGLSGIELVGKNVYDLEAQHVFYPSATVVVLEERRPVTLIQSTSTGRRLLVTANPVFDEAGNLIRVVSNSMDVTEILTLKQQIEEMERVIQEYSGQLDRLRKANLGAEGTLVAKSKPMVRVLQLLERVSRVDTNVLLLGESGVGKTEVAYWLHRISHRKDGPFIEVNCGSIPPSLFESELFGYERGSFSGALTTGKIGLLESAQHGTLFLDEIGELPLELQAKLLQVIQSKSFMRVGGRERIALDVRLIAATNQNLEKMVEAGSFRLDLYYRLNVVSVTIPPLRERPEDLIELMHVLLHRVNQKYQFEKVFSPAIVEQFLAYPWPGNVRELQNVIERVAITSDSRVIHPDSLAEVLRAEVPLAAGGDRSGSGPGEKADGGDWLRELMARPDLGLEDMMAIVERKILTHFMNQLGSTRKVAKRLRVSQSTVSRKLPRQRTL